jgi:hypothetical protein
VYAQSLRDVTYRNYFVGEGDDGWYWSSKIAHVVGFPCGPLPSADDAKQDAQRAERSSP